ncbi:MAG TPA: hypothetical protein VGI06_12265, partial [Acidimicrobiales bacterium]
MSAGTGGKPQERSTPPAGGGEAEERFAVPTELLRLAGDHEAAPPPASPRPRPSSPGRPVPPTPAVRVSDGVVADAVLPALGTAVTLATLFAERACGHRIERSLHIGTTGIGGLLVVAAGAALAGAPFMGWLADRAGRRRVAGVAIGVAAV